MKRDTMKRDTSTSSAARFFELRSGRRIRAPRVEPIRPGYISVPDPWYWLRHRTPGSLAAWQSQVALPVEEFVLGTTGRPERAVAIDRGCYTNGYTACRCRVFTEGRWILRPHKPVEWQAFPPAPRPQIEEHW